MDASAGRDLYELASTTTDDFYALLDVPIDASEATIKTAYRKASIRHHPDKNLDDKDAADRFITLGWARDILQNASLKAEYDRARGRRRERAQQDEKMDSRRKKFKDDLLRAEEDASLQRQTWKRKRPEDMTEREKEAQRQEQEHERIRAVNERKMQEIRERLVRQREEELEEQQRWQKEQQDKDENVDDLRRTLKVQFYRDTVPAEWSDTAHLRELFSRFGPLDSFTVGYDKKVRRDENTSSKHRRRLATVWPIYKRLSNARSAVILLDSEFEGLLHRVEWARLASSEDDEKRKTINSTAPPEFRFSPAAYMSGRRMHEEAMQMLRVAEKRRLEKKIRREEAAEAAEEE